MCGHGNAVSQKTFSLCWPVSIVNVASHSKAVLLWQTLDHGHTYMYLCRSWEVSVCMCACRNVRILYIVCIAEVISSIEQVWFRVALHYHIFITSHSTLYKY